MLIQPITESSINSLCAAVSTDIGMPVGRVRKVVLAVLRHQQGQAVAGAEPGGEGGLAAGIDPGDPLRWYPLGANGRLRPPQPQQP